MGVEVMIEPKFVEFITPSGTKYCLNIEKISGLFYHKPTVTNIVVGEEVWEAKGSYDEVKYYLQLQHVEIWELPKENPEHG